MLVTTAAVAIAAAAHTSAENATHILTVVASAGLASGSLGAWLAWFLSDKFGRVYKILNSLDRRLVRLETKAGIPLRDDDDD